MIEKSHEPQARADPSLVGTLFIALLIWLLAIPAWGATAGKPGSAPPTVPAEKPATEPQVYEVTDIIPRSERTLARLREIRNKFDADTSVDLIDRALSQSGMQLEEWWKAESPAISEGRSVQRVNDLAWELTARHSQIEAWKELLADSGKAWIAEAQALDRGLATWQMTRSALKADAPPAVLVRVDQVLIEIETVQQLYRDKTARLVEIQGRLAAHDNALQRIRAEFEASRIHSARGLFAQDSRTLWTLLFVAEATQSIASEFEAGLNRLRNDFMRLIGITQPNAVLHAALFVGILGLMLLFRQHSLQPGALQPTHAERIILDRSVFSALLLVISTLPLFYTDQSPQILRFLIIPALIPLLALTPAILGPRLRATFYFFLAIFLLDFLRNYLPPQWPSARLLLLTVSALGAAGFIRLLQRPHWLHSADEWFHGATRALCLIGAALFICSALANIIGNISLAEYLVSPIMRLVFMAITIRIGVVISTTFLVMAMRTPIALLSRIIKEHGEAAAVKVRRFVGWTGVVIWIYLALFNLGMLAAMQDSVVAIMKTEWQVGAAVISVRGFITFFMVLLASYFLSRLLRLILAEEIFPRISFPRGVPDALVLIARYGVLLFGFLLALTSAGVDLSQVTIALSALGVGIGFGLQGVVNNFVCGLILVFEHPIQVGDYIEAGPHYGQVTRIGFRASIVTTRDGSEVVIPNSELIGGKVVNWSLSDSIRRLEILVPVAYGVDTARVIDVLQSTASAHPRVRSYPPPKVILSQFGEHSLDFRLQCWTRTDDMFDVRPQLTLAIDQAFREAGIRIPFPQADVHLHYADQPEITPAMQSAPK